MKALPTTSPGRIPIPGLPDGSYAAAAKCLKTSGKTVEERLTVAEALLNTSVRLNPRPERLVLEHIVYALSSPKPDFQPYRARYWALLRRLIPCVVPSSVVSTAAKSLLCADEIERLECVRTLESLLASDGLHLSAEKLGQLAGIALEKAPESLGVALLIEFDTVSKRNHKARATFSIILESLLWPILKSTGILRDAGEIVLRNGIFSNPADLLNMESTYFKDLFFILSNSQKASHPELIPQLAGFLMGAVREMSSSKRDQIAGLEFPKGGTSAGTGRKRNFAQANAETGAKTVTDRDTLPIDINIPYRFLVFALHALMKNLNINNDAGKSTKEEEQGQSLAAITNLLNTAADLGVYRPLYDESHLKVVEKSKKKTNIKNAYDTIGTLISQLLPVLTEKLTGGNVTDVVQLAGCTKAIIKLVQDSREDALLQLLTGVSQCADGVKAKNQTVALKALVDVMCELFRVYRATRKIPFLFKTMTTATASSRGVLNHFYILLANKKLQETVVECIRKMPTVHSEDCVRYLCGTKWETDGKMASGVCYLLSLFVEVVDFHTLQLILPLIGEHLEGSKIDIRDTSDLGAATLFLHASIACALARNSAGQSAPFATKLDFDRIFKSADKFRRKSVAAKSESSLSFTACELRFLAGFMHLQLVEVEKANLNLDGKDFKSEIGRAFISRLALLPLEFSSTENNFSCESNLLCSGSESFLRTIASVVPILDLCVSDNKETENGLSKLLTFALIHAKADDVFWDGILETKFAKQFMGPAALAILKSKNTKVCASVLEILPKISRHILSEEYRTKLSAEVEGLSVVNSNLSPVIHALRNPAVDLDARNTSLSDKLLRKMDGIIEKESTRLETRLKTSNFECSRKTLDFCGLLLKELLGLKDVMKVLEEHRSKLSAVAVIVFDYVLYGKDQLGTSLQLLSILARDRSNPGIEGARGILGRKVGKVDEEMRGEGSMYNSLTWIPWVKRLVCTSTALMCGSRGISADFDWACPPNGVVSNIERASRMLQIHSIRHCGADIQLVTNVLQAVLSLLWRTRRYCRHNSNSDGRSNVFDIKIGDDAVSRGQIFKSNRQREEHAAEIRECIEWAGGTVILVSKSTSNEDGRILLNVLTQCLSIGMEYDMYAIVKSVTLIAHRRPNLRIAGLRCMRAALGGHLEEKTARVIARFYETVAGPPTVAALVDLSVGLVKVKDGKVRRAMEHGAAALIRQLDERGRDEALRGCSENNARDVLRALVESYRLDFEYGRSYN